MLEEIVREWEAKGWNSWDQALGEELYQRWKDKEVTIEEALRKSGFVHWFSASSSLFDDLLCLDDLGQWTTHATDPEEAYTGIDCDIYYAFKDRDPAIRARLIITG